MRSSGGWVKRASRLLTRTHPTTLRFPTRQIARSGLLEDEEYQLMKTLLWQHLLCNEDDARALGAALNLHPTVARLLCMRGLGDPEMASRFLQPSLDHLHDPLRLADLIKAVERIEAAIARKERIAIHGDYDVDGITSTVILRRA